MDYKVPYEDFDPHILIKRQQAWSEIAILSKKTITHFHGTT